MTPVSSALFTSRFDGAVVIPDVGHFLAEEAPDELLSALATFLAPYRDASVTASREPDGVS